MILKHNIVTDVPFIFKFNILTCILQYGHALTLFEQLQD